MPRARQFRAAAGGQGLKNRGRVVLRAVLVAALAALWLAGCAGLGSAGDGGRGAEYVVRPGDTLYSIARRFRVDHRDLARWNRLGDGSLIYPGQRLRLGPGTTSGVAAAPGKPAATPRKTAPVAPEVPPPASGWRWPASGRLLGGFGASARTASGILLGGQPGQVVVASADGEVVYAGSGLTGYGLLVIVRHNQTWLTAYGHHADLLVREGERVRAGQAIGHMGPGAGHDAVLHFEIRRNGIPVDPLRQLPARGDGQAGLR